MADVAIGYDGITPSPNGTALPPADTTGGKANKWAVGALAGLKVDRFKVRTDATTGAGLLRVLVYDDDNGGLPGTLLGTGCIGVAAGAGATYTGYFTEGFLMPASGFVWVLPVGAAGTALALEQYTTTPSSADCENITGNATFQLEVNNPATSAATARDMAIQLVADDEQTYDEFIGDNISHVTAAGTNIRFIVLSRFSLAGINHGFVWNKVAWLRRNDAFGTAKVRLVCYADDGTGDPGQLIAQIEEASFPASPSFDGEWQVIDWPDPFDLTDCTDYVFVGIETDGGANVNRYYYASEEGGTEGWRMSTGLAAWSDLSAPADLSAIAPHTTSDAQYALAVGLIGVGDAGAGGGGFAALIAAAVS